MCLHLQHPRSIAVVDEAADLIRDGVGDGLQAVLRIPGLRVGEALGTADSDLLNQCALSSAP